MTTRNDLWPNAGVCLLEYAQRRWNLRYGPTARASFFSIETKISM